MTREVVYRCDGLGCIREIWVDADLDEADEIASLTSEGWIEDAEVNDWHYCPKCSKTIAKEKQ